MVCKHLSELEQAILSTTIVETYRGRPWSKQCREWVYFACILDVNEIQRQYNLPSFVVLHNTLERMMDRSLG